jgi:hypothetical protein
MALSRDLRSRRADSDNDLLRKIADALAIGLGQRGHDRFNGATAATDGEWAVLHALSAATVTVVRDGSTETISLAAGDRIYGAITNVTVASGDVEVYRAD